jgi:hypothetical protein
MESEWDVSGETARELYSFNTQPLQFDRDYQFWVAFNKPMRWREDGEVVPLPGQPNAKQDLDAELIIEGGELTVIPTVGFWADQPGGAPNGYMHYRDDALNIEFSIPANENNMGLVDGVEPVTLSLNAWDMTGTRLDANPATVARWVDGSWSGFEDTDGEDRNNVGGYDETTQFQVTSEDLGDPFVIEPGSPEHPLHGLTRPETGKASCWRSWITTRPSCTGLPTTPKGTRTGTSPRVRSAGIVSCFRS